MNANPPINVSLAAQRSKRTKQKIVQQMMQRKAAPGAVGRGAQAAGGGRSIFAGQRGKLPQPHITRQSRLAPALIAALGIGGAGIPDQAVGGIANGVQDNVATQAQGIPDWAPQPGASAPMDDGSLPGGTYTYDPGNGQPTMDVPNGINAPSEPGGLFTGSTGAPILEHPDWTSQSAQQQSPYANNANYIHLGNGIYYDTKAGNFIGPSGMRMQ